MRSSPCRSEVGEQELLDFVAARMPKYKRPRSVAIWPELPKSPAGKILRREVREKERERLGCTMNGMDAYIVDVVRTPFGRGRETGVLAAAHPVDLLSTVLVAIQERTGIDPGLIEDAIVGCVQQVGRAGRQHRAACGPRIRLAARRSPG